MNGHTRKRHKPECAHRADKRKRCNCNGSWQGRYADPANPSKKVERTFSTKQEALDWLASQRHSQLSGSYVDPRQAEMPFSAVVEEWRGSWSARLSPTTAQRYASILDTYLLKEFGAVPVGRIDHGVVQRYVDRLAAARDDEGNPQHAPGTVRNVYAVLRTAMAKAVRLGWVKSNPCADIDLPKPARQEMLFLSHQEVAALAEKIDQHFRLAVVFSAYSGLRAGELAGLRWGDVDLLRGVVHVRRSVRDVSGKLQTGDLKTAYSRRTVTLPKQAVCEQLSEHLNAAAEAGRGTGPDDYVFTMKNGGPLRMEAVYSRYFKRAVRGWTDGWGKHHPGALPAEKHGLRWHDLRHTAASLMIASGAHPKLVSTCLGHSSINITMDRYGHLFPQMHDALAEALDAAFVAAGATTEAQSNVVALPQAESR